MDHPLGSRSNIANINTSYTTTADWNNLFFVSEYKKEILFLWSDLLCSNITCMQRRDSIPKELEIHFRSSQCSTNLVSILGIQRRKRDLTVSWRWNKISSVQAVRALQKGP